MGKQPERPVCRTCKGTNVSLEVTAYFCDVAGEVVVGDVCEKGHYCEDCDGECRLDWVPFQPSP